MTKEAAIKLMESRGYKMVSEAGNETWVGFAKDMHGIWMSAKVHLAQESISLQGGILKMACKLSCDKFDVNTTKFADFENVLYLYAKICGQIDDLVDAEGIIKKAFSEASAAIKIKGVTEDEDEGTTEVVSKNTLEARMTKFKQEVIAIGKKKGYPPSMCKKFFNYWSETNSQGKKMRWEIQKQKSGVFNTLGRMVTWYGKDQEGMFKDRDEKKAEKLNNELKKKPTTINVKELF